MWPTQRRRCLIEEECADEAIEKSTDFRCWPIASLRRCRILLLSAHSGSRGSARENFRELITYATSRSVVSSALVFSARGFSGEAMVAPMFSLRALRLCANTG
jgi:hypothetical protein